jgi:DNA gyrase subunit A
MVIKFLIDEVRKTGRAAQGVKLLNLGSDQDKVVGIAKIDGNAMALDDEEDLVMDADLATPGPDESGEQAKLDI